MGTIANGLNSVRVQRLAVMARCSAPETVLVLHQKIAVEDVPLLEPPRKQNRVI